MFPDRLLRYRQPIIFGIHLLLIPLGYYLAFALRFDFQVPQLYRNVFWLTVPFLVALRFGSLAVFGLHRGWWRHVGLDDLIDLVKAITLSSFLFLVTLFLLGRPGELPRSVLLLDWAIAIFLFGGARFAVRGLREGRFSLRRRKQGIPTLLIGAGDAAERLIRQMKRGGSRDMEPVAILDDDPATHGMKLHGVSVLGGTERLHEFATRTHAGLVVIAIPSANRADMQRIVDRCMTSGVEFKIVPSLRELIDGRVKVSQLRTVQIDDLLGRDPVDLNLDQIRADLQGRRVLVTGAAGSIGAELARQIAEFSPSRLILLEQAESPLYFCQLELKRAYPGLDLVPVVADVRNRLRLEKVFEHEDPEYVFHAAAYKHVPLMEENVTEAVENNVIGTLNAAECAVAIGVSKFVLVSTDKAVKPSSVMGATKRIAERIVLGWPGFRDSSTDFRAVRFGNVLGSQGSVIPLFRKQLAEGAPLTVTHPSVTRYFMTISESVQLVLQAAALPEARGCVSMLEMGEPVRIVDLAESLVRLSGLEPYKDVPIVFTGLRPGEKLYEELMSEVEATVPTSVEKIRIVRTDEADGKKVRVGMDRLVTALELNDSPDAVLAICSLVPECVPPLRNLAASLALRAAP
ncbi:MAG: polysaccharide biosynthesis protein [Longimicrobiaceae bacterium]